MRINYVDSEGEGQEGGFVFQGPINDDVSIIIITSYLLCHKKPLCFIFVLTILVVNYAVLLHLLGEIWREKESHKKT